MKEWKKCSCLRCFCKQINKIFSGFEEIVPQGLMLELVLFNVLLNDFFTLLEMHLQFITNPDAVHNFADDNTRFFYTSNQVAKGLTFKMA